MERWRARPRIGLIAIGQLISRYGTRVFALGFREALEAAVVVMVIATILRRTGYQRRLLSAVAAAAAGSVAVVLVVRSSGAWVGDSGRHVVKLLVSIGAVAVLTSTARWIYEYRRSGAPVPMTPSGAGALVATASFAIVREGFEIALLPAASADNQWAAGSSALVLGVLAGTAVGIVGYMAAAGSVERTTTWAPPVLLVMAAGLTTGVARSSHVVFGIDSGALFEVRSLVP